MQAEPVSNPPRRRPLYGIYAYTAREWDPETTLYFYRARYYDPKVGRFISEDLIRNEGGINFYAYVLGNPANAADPTGLKIQVCQRKAKKWWMGAVGGNHAYFWDPRERSHMTPRDSGKDDFMSSSPATTGAEKPDPMTTECRDVEDSDGKEDLLMICCRAESNSTASTCWGGLVHCLKKYGLTMPDDTPMFGCTGAHCSP
ncbi:MAG: RHS repeat-associated core domain-containing protein [Acidobacteria bacterium]|nr:RHS repeat-associated core domain-containing protein [Acidobacteriota bacterium]